MADDITLGEIVRRFDDFKIDVRDDIKELRAHIDQMGNRMESKTVGLDFYKVRHSALDDKVSELQQRMTTANAIIETNRIERRRIWAAVLIAFIGQLSEFIVLLAHIH